VRSYCCIDGAFRSTLFAVLDACFDGPRVRGGAFCRSRYFAANRLEGFDTEGVPQGGLIVLFFRWIVHSITCWDGCGRRGVRSRRMQPQDFTLPSRSLSAVVTRSFPHKHRQRQSRLPLWSAPLFSMTDRRANTALVRFTSLLAMCNAPRLNVDRIAREFFDLETGRLRAISAIGEARGAMGACLVWGLPRRAGLRPHMTLTRAHMNPVGTARRYSASPSPSPPKTKGLVQMATHTVNTRIACGNRFRVHALADGSWRIGFTTRLGYRDFPADPATDAAFAEFYRMTTADQIDAAAGDLMARGPMTRTRALLPATV
jgi:hypothetical protein